MHWIDNNANSSGTNKASYTPTNAALQSCPAVNSDWLATASPLPPNPQPQLCTCMNNVAPCVVKDSVTSANYGDFFCLICSYTDRTGIARNATAGTYGAYGMCTPKQQLNFLLNKYYSEQGSASSACNFGGSATVTSVTKATVPAATS